ncbi:MAG: zinc-binding alcohol dehydrogenase family protein [Deltaproteobacteria bacterium]|nr:zinc-binding alcohol dehydrogenase family protein [Deltaproteobacteria bacterium]
MRALQFSEFGPVSNLRLVELPDPRPDAETAVVKIAAASIAPSDVKNVEGKMEHTTLPRVPGRDYAGCVVSGPKEWIGAEVWGTGGEIGYSINGSHADLIAVPIASLRHKPRSLSLQQAAAIGLTYLAAWLGLVEYACVARGETILVIGANGGVGGAAAQIGKWRGARVIGVDREKVRSDSPSAGAIDDFFVLESEPLKNWVHRATNGRGADVVFDSVGGPMFEPALRALAHRGRQLEIASAVERRVSFDLIDFYHNESRLFGVDTRARDAIASAALLEDLVPFFEQDTFRPPAIDRAIPLADGRKAYEDVDRGQVRGRIVLTP